MADAAAVLGRVDICIGARCRPFSTWLQHKDAIDDLLSNKSKLRTTRCSQCNANSSMFLVEGDEAFQPSASISRADQLERKSDLDYLDVFTNRPGFKRFRLESRLSKELRNALFQARSKVTHLPEAQLNLSVDAKVGKLVDATKSSHNRSIPLPALVKTGWVPTLAPAKALSTRAFRHFGEAKPPYLGYFMPCSTARGEDVAVLRSFFTDWETGHPLQPRGHPSYLEMGGLDGELESTTLVFDRCLGWRGVLVEAQPSLFRRMSKYRSGALNLHAASCAQFQTINFTRFGTAFDKPATAATAAGTPLISVPCVPLGTLLESLTVRRLDFFSLDCEGCELDALKSLGKTLAVGVVVVEVRGDGQRRDIFKLLLKRGLSYAGLLHARGTVVNYVMDDVFVNASFLREWWPRSRYLRP